MVGQMRLAWWREALGRLDSAPAPAEPVLQALAARCTAGRCARGGAGGDGRWLGAAARHDRRRGDRAIMRDCAEACCLRRPGSCSALMPTIRSKRAGQGWALADLRGTPQRSRAGGARSRRGESGVGRRRRVTAGVRDARALGALAHGARLDLAGPRDPVAGGPPRLASADRPLAFCPLKFRDKASAINGRGVARCGGIWRGQARGRCWSRRE